VDKPTSLTRDRIRELFARFSGQRVLVIGDMVADEYIVGRPVRLSREAPVPVLEWEDRYIIPGGAANVARNLRSMGCEVEVAGVVGQDEAGETLRQRLTDDAIGIDGLAVEPSRPTSTKTRVIGGSSQVVSQQIARIDRVVRREIDGSTKGYLVDYLHRTIPTVDALLVSDYENGVINADLLAVALPLARKYRLVTTVDSHGDLWRFQGITIATPNQDEASATLGRPLLSDDDVYRGGVELVRRLESRGVLITRGSEGMTLVEATGAYHHLPVTSRREVRDTTGAGDTVSAVVTIASCAGASLLEAAQISNLAAGIVVRRLGAVTTTTAEILAEYDAIHRVPDHLLRLDGV
jgi:D-glycero-beta-D-manno-heptose-7-phosphate kinase